MFDKEAYWKEKPTNIGSVRNKKKSVAAPTPNSVEIGFSDSGGFIAKNRAWRRKKKVTRLFTRKGFIERLWAIRIVRKRNGKIKTKYIFNLYK